VLPSRVVWLVTAPSAVTANGPTAAVATVGIATRPARASAAADATAISFLEI